MTHVDRSPSQPEDHQYGAMCSPNTCGADQLKGQNLRLYVLDAKMVIGTCIDICECVYTHKYVYIYIHIYIYTYIYIDIYIYTHNLHFIAHCVYIRIYIRTYNDIQSIIRYVHILCWSCCLQQWIRKQEKIARKVVQN